MAAAVEHPHPLPSAPPSSVRLVWLHPLLSLQLTQRKDSHHISSLSTSLLNHRGTNTTPHDHLTPPLSSFFFLLLSPHFIAISHSLAFSSLSLISIQPLKIKTELWRDNLFFFSWRWALKIHVYVYKDTRQHLNVLCQEMLAASQIKKVLITKVNAKHELISHQHELYNRNENCKHTF